MRFIVGIVLALIGTVLFVLGLFTWNSVLWTVLGFLLGLIGMVALRSG